MIQGGHRFYTLLRLCRRSLVTGTRVSGHWHERTSYRFEAGEFLEHRRAYTYSPLSCNTCADTVRQGSYRDGSIGQRSTGAAHVLKAKHKQAALLSL